MGANCVLRTREGWRRDWVAHLEAAVSKRKQTRALCMCTCTYGAVCGSTCGTHPSAYTYIVPKCLLNGVFSVLTLGWWVWAQLGTHPVLMLRSMECCLSEWCHSSYLPETECYLWRLIENSVYFLIPPPPRSAVGLCYSIPTFVYLNALKLGYPMLLSDPRLADLLQLWCIQSTCMLHSSPKSNFYIKHASTIKVCFPYTVPELSKSQIHFAVRMQSHLFLVLPDEDSLLKREHFWREDIFILAAESACVLQVK